MSSLLFDFCNICACFLLFPFSASTFSKYNHNGFQLSVEPKADIITLTSEIQ